MHKYFVLLLLILLFAKPSSVSAAACSNASNYGTVTSNINVPVAGSYIIWTRINVPDVLNNSYQLEIDNGTCFQVGGASISPNTWTWVDYQTSGQADKVKHDFTAGNHQLRLLGAKTGVKVDKLILIGAEENCSTNGKVPKDDGANCASGVATTVSTPNTSSNGSAPSTPTGPAIPVSGTVIPEIIKDENVEKVEYFVNNKLIQENDAPVGLDTTLLENGEHVVTTKVTYDDGTTALEVQKVEVNNPQNALSPVKRWLRLNKRPLFYAASVIGAAGLAYSIFIGVRVLRSRRLFLKTHGF
jgi:hypothetical protein